MKKSATLEQILEFHHRNKFYKKETLLFGAMLLFLLAYAFYSNGLANFVFFSVSIVVLIALTLKLFSIFHVRSLEYLEIAHEIEKSIAGVNAQTLTSEVENERTTGAIYKGNIPWADIEKIAHDDDNSTSSSVSKSSLFSDKRKISLTPCLSYDKYGDVILHYEKDIIPKQDEVDDFPYTELLYPPIHTKISKVQEIDSLATLSKAHSLAHKAELRKANIEILKVQSLELSRQYESISEMLNLMSQEQHVVSKNYVRFIHIVYYILIRFFPEHLESEKKTNKQRQLKQ